MFWALLTRSPLVSLAAAAAATTAELEWKLFNIVGQSVSQNAAGVDEPDEELPPPLPPPPTTVPVES